MQSTFLYTHPLAELHLPFYYQLSLRASRRGRGTPLFYFIDCVLLLMNMIYREPDELSISIHRAFELTLVEHANDKPGAEGDEARLDGILANFSCHRLAHILDIMLG